MYKRILAVLLAAALCFALAAPAFAALVGDVDGNGKVSTEDARSVLRAAIGLDPLRELPDAGEAPFDYDKVPDEAPAENNVYELAYVVMPGELKDGSFNQSTWNAVKRFAYESGKTYKYYVPAGGEEASPDQIRDAVDAALKGGAKTVVVCSFFFENALLELAPANPETEFIYVDGCALEDGAGKLIPNVLGVTFKTEEAGFLAGYAAVMDGCTALGFSGGGGGMNPSVNLYGFGFLQGANAAAKELNKTVKMNWSYRFGDTFSPSDELTAQMKAWFTEDGVEAVMSCGGGMIISALDAANEVGGKVIAVDDDLGPAYGELILTSACKNMCGAAYAALGVCFGGRLTEYPDCEFAGGIAENGVMLPEDSWTMKTYTTEKHAAFLQRFAEGKYAVSGDLDKLSDPAFRTNVDVKDC